MTEDLSWRNKLTPINRLALLDVLIDIQDEIQLNPRKPTIPLFQPIVKFAELMPTDGINMRDRYCEIRYKAMELLRDQRIISDLNVMQSDHRWGDHLTFQADPKLVDILVKRLKSGTAPKPSAASRSPQKKHPLAAASSESTTGKKVIFVGHGGSNDWRALKDFLAGRLQLEVIEFNSISPAGVATKERLEQLLGVALFAFIVTTAEDRDPEGKLHARENVIHEIGLFQGRLGFSKAIIVLEQGCEEFSNIEGLGQLRYGHNKIGDTFEEVRRVLEREGVIT